MQQTTISNQVFEQKAKEAIASSPLRKEMLLTDIELIDKEAVSINGKRVSITSQAFKDLIELLGLPKAFLGRFGEVFGEDNLQTFINRMRVAQATKKNTNVTLVANPSTHQVIRILGGNKSAISNDSAIDFAKRYIDGYNLDVSQFHVGPNGDLSINTTSPNGYFTVPGMKDEHFTMGVSFINSPDRGLEVSPFLNRLVCANGMIGRSMSETYRLRELTPQSIEHFNEQMLQLQAVNFAPQGFADRIIKADSTKASLEEMNWAASKLMTVSDVDYNHLQKWIPIQATNDTFSRHGFDVNKLTKHQLKNASTGTSINDLYNAMTNFATHTHNGVKVEDYNRTKLMIDAGHLLTKNTYDTENLITSPFLN